MTSHNQDATILLVEDDHVDAMAIQRAFRKRRIANPFVVARDGLEALEMLRGEGRRPPVPRPFLILLDLNLPRMNGLQFLDELRRDPDLHDSIVFVLTTSKEDRDIVGAYQHHVAGYLVKTDAGENFLNVVLMLDRFVVSVRFPPESEIVQPSSSGRPL